MCFLILLFKTTLLLKRIIRGDHPGKQLSKHRQTQLKLGGLRPNNMYNNKKLCTKIKSSNCTCISTEKKSHESYQIEYMDKNWRVQ